MIVPAAAEPEDAEAIVRFQLAMASETEGVELDRETVTRGVKAVFDDPRKGQYFVVRDDDAIIASLLITYEWSDWRDGWVWWIQSVWVEPDSRGRGVYRKLYDHVLARAHENDARGVRLYVDERNKRAQAVYRKLGMDGDHYRVFEEMS